MRGLHYASVAVARHNTQLCAMCDKYATLWETLPRSTSRHEGGWTLCLECLDSMPAPALRAILTKMENVASSAAFTRLRLL